MNAVGVLRAIFGRERLKRGFDLIESGGVENFAEVGVPEKLFKLRLIDGKSLGAAFGEWRVAVVNVIGNVAEKKRACERRRLIGFDHRDFDFATLNLRKKRGDGGQIKNIANALTIGLEKNRERRETSGDGQQVGGAFALLPEWSALAGAAARKKQSARGSFAEFRGEHGSRPELPENERFHFSGRGQEHR